MESVETELRNIKEKLKTTEQRLESVLDLVYKTFTGSSNAAQELSKIVGVPAPILCSDDENVKPKLEANKDMQNGTTATIFIESQQKLNNRLGFLNQVMHDHDKMMRGYYDVSDRNPVDERTMNQRKHKRTKSADRTMSRASRAYHNPYTWNMPFNTNDFDNIYKYESPLPTAICRSKPLIDKASGKQRPHTQQDNIYDIRTDDFLYNSNNRRQSKSNNGIKPDVQDWSLEPNSAKPPKSSRPPSSVSYQRKIISRNANISRNLTPYHQLELQTMTESDKKAEELLQAMERRFELSTIDLQRRLGISQAGMVGP